ncbi:MAG TPA: ABC transporter substrate-binding protein [Vicinamibacterales bacterium]|jgi:peptide/nickel transport system substrate-binding protein|nr:ABC transporter substrate-binding protein [Vicinamibacterales bacterium]
MTTCARSLVSLVVLSALPALSACSRTDERTPHVSALRIGVPVPPSAGGASGVPNVIGLLTTESLIINTTDGRPAERLAKSWAWNADHTVLHIELRQGVLFHDGTPLTPDVVADSVRRAVADQNGLALASVKRIETTPAGIDIVLPAPDTFLLDDLGVLPITRPDTPAVGTGPYKLLNSGATATLAAFDKYYKGTPNIQSITVSSYPTQRNAWAALMRSDIDMLQEVSPEALDFVAAESAVRAYSFPKPYYYVLAFNVRHPILSNVEVRRAINEAIDKNGIVAEGLHGRARPASDPIWPEFWAASPEKGIQFDPVAADRRLESAGYTVKPGDATHPPGRIRINCLVWADDSRLTRTALMLQKQLDAVGINLVLQPVPLKQLVPQIRTGQFDMFLFEMANARTLSFVYMFWHSPRSDAPTFNFTGYTAADASLDAIRAATSDDEIRKQTAALQDVFASDPPAVFLAWQTMTRAVSTKFTVPPQPARDIIYSIWQWKPSDGRQFAER